jgi:hypothetical protein
MITIGKASWAVVTAGLLVMGAGSSAFGEEETVQAIAPWQGSGQAFAVAPEKVMILGEYTGILYVQAKTGALDAALMQCPAVQVLDTNPRRGEASGHCTFTDGDGDAVYSEWKCTGAVGACAGELTITGGTGKFTGISGGGPMVVRAALAETAANASSGAVIRGAVGLAIWPELKYRIPGR